MNPVFRRCWTHSTCPTANVTHLNWPLAEPHFGHVAVPDQEGTMHRVYPKAMRHKVARRVVRRRGVLTWVYEAD